MTNIVMICVDSLRRDRLVYYGYPEALHTTPCLDRYFKNSYKFNAISPSSWTPTVMASIFSSLYPWEHRVLKDEHGQLVERYSVLSSGLLCFKEYYKVCITGNPWLHPMFYLTKDFDDVKYVSPSWHAEHLNAVLLNTLTELKKSRNLLFLHYMDVHEPYDTTFKDKINIDMLKQIHGDDPRQSTINSRGGCKWNSLEENIYYTSGILKADFYINEALQMLKQVGFLEDSAIIFFADHGEELRDHGRLEYPRHSQSLYNELITVPLLIKINKPIKFDSNEFIEIRTLFFLLRDIIEGKNLQRFRANEIISYVAYGDEIGSIFDPAIGRKYIYNFSKDEAELYNLNNDCRERYNIKEFEDVSMWQNKLKDKMNMFNRRRGSININNENIVRDIDVSIIIVNWNTKEYLEACLNSIYDNIRKTTFEVIVVDNNSLDKSTAMIKEYFPEVRLIENKENIGFAAGNNQGFRESKGKFITVLNPDTLILPNAIENMLNFATSTANIGAVSCLYLNHDRTFQRYYNRLLTPLSIVFCFTKVGRIIDRVLFRRKFSEYYYARDIDFSKIVEVEQPAASCLLLPRGIIEKIGLFDESLRVYFNDVDLCKRIIEEGYKIYVIPDAKIVHHGHGSANKATNNVILHELNHGLYLYVKKHFGVLAGLFVKFLIFIGVISPDPNGAVSKRNYFEKTVRRKREDLYKVLNIPASSTDEVIKKYTETKKKDGLFLSEQSIIVSEDKMGDSSLNESEEIKDRLKKLGYL